MHRSRWMSILLVLAMLVTPLAVLFVPAAPAAAAAPVAQAAAPDDEVVVLTTTGQIRVEDPYTAPGYTPATWDSGTDVGWTAVAAGDLNADGDAEIVAVRGGTLRIFDPFVPVGSSPASGEIILTSGLTWRPLIAVADFDRDGRAEIAALHTETVSGIRERLKIFDGGSTATIWTQVFQDQFGANWSDITTGDYNADGAADLALARYTTTPSLDNRIKMWNGLNWSALAERTINLGTPLVGLASGNLSSAYAGSELIALRTGTQAAVDSVLMFRLSAGQMVDLIPNTNGSRFFPEFRSVAAGDLNGDGDAEVALARDPQVTTNTSVFVMNPAGAAVSFQVAIGAGTSAFRLVRTGDTDGDGRAEIVLLRNDRYRIYNSPESSTTNLNDYLGNFYVSASVTNFAYMAVANVDGAGRVAGPTLSVSPQNLSYDLDFGQATQPQAIQVQNIGTAAPLAWQAAVVGSAPWIMLSKTSGTTPDTFNLTINSSAVNPGTYTGTVRVTSSTPGVQASPQDINVSLTLRGSGLIVSPGSVSFSAPYGTVAEQMLSVSIAAAGVQGWTAQVESGSPWLTVSPTSGVSPDMVRVSANTTLAGVGTKYGSIRITATSPGIVGSPRLVNVELTVPDPGFVVTPNLLVIFQPTSGPAVHKSVSIYRPGAAVAWTAASFPAATPAEVAEKAAAGAITVGDDGEVLIDGAVPENVPWLIFTPTSGTTNPNTPTTMDVSVAPGTAPGSYHATIVIVAQDASLPQTVFSVEVAAVVGDNIIYQYMPQMLR